MLSIARTIFGRLYEFDPAKEEEKLRAHEDEPQHGDLSLSVPTTITPQAVDNHAISPGSHGEETTTVTQDSTSDAANITAGGTVSPVVVPRPCGFKYMFINLFSHLIRRRWASCSLRAPSGARQHFGSK